MNNMDRGILTGMVLGDGYLKVCRDKRWDNSWHSAISFTHSSKQSEYLLHKAKLLVSMFGGKKPNIQSINNNGYDGVRFSKSNKYFRVLKKKMYNDNVKTISLSVLNYLTPQGIALWWMDDGSLYLKKRGGKVHAREGILSTYLDYDSNKLIADWFKENYDVEFAPVKSKGSYRLRINTTNLKKFIPIVEKYIIPSMNHKIDMRYCDTRIAPERDEIVRAYLKR